MAKDNKKAAREAEVAAMLPEGFTQVTSSSSGKWLVFEEGARFEGELLGRFKLKKAGRDGKERFYYQVKLSKPAKVSVKIEGDTTEEIAEIGEVVNFDEKTALSDLATYCGGAKRHNVIVIVQEKIDIDGGQTFWRCVAGVKPL